MESEISAEFLEHLRRKGRKPDTIDEYASSIRMFTEHLTTHGEFSLFAAKEETLYHWRQKLVAAGNQAWSAGKKLLCVHAFYEWMHTSGYLLVNPLPKPSFSGVQRLPRRLPDAQGLCKAFKTLRASRKLFELRDYVALDLGYSCGLRRCELHALNLQDINATEGIVKVRGKGSRERVVPIGPATLKDLQYYIYHVRPKLLSGGGNTNALLVSWRKGGSRMNARSINRAFVRLRRKYGFGDAFTPHGLRHAFATELVRNGAPVQDVSKMLGHAKLETTQVYTHLAARDLKHHHRSHHPRG